MIATQLLYTVCLHFELQYNKIPGPNYKSLFVKKEHVKKVKCWENNKN